MQTKISKSDDFGFLVYISFSRLVELDKLRLQTRKEEAKELASKGIEDPNVIVMPPSASKGGVSEKLVKVIMFMK